MSVFIIKSNVKSGHGIGDFCVYEDEHYMCTQCESVVYMSCCLFGLI